MAMPRRTNSDACSEIQKRVAVYIFYNRAMAPLGNKRIVPGIRRGHKLGVAFHNALGVGSGQCGNQPRKFRFRRGNHLFLLGKNGKRLMWMGYHKAGLRAHTKTRPRPRSEEHTSELQSQSNLVCRLLLE